MFNNFDQQVIIPPGTGNGNAIPPTNLANAQQLQSVIQLQLVKNLSTGNLMLDIIIQMFIVSFVGYFMTKIKEIMDTIFYYCGVIRVYVWGLLIKFYERFIKKKVSIIKPKEKITKNIQVPYITENRQINELYRAVSWYLMNNKEVDLTKESNLQYIYEKSISIECDAKVRANLGINKLPKANKNNVIKFGIYIIHFSFSTDIITVYTDKEKKRENYVINLTTEFEEVCKNDILEEFCQFCIIKYLDSLVVGNWAQLIYINNNGDWTSKSSNNTRKMETIILKNNLKDAIKDDLQLFLNSKDWYKHRDIPYTRGYLFYGFPGTGKTSMIKAMSLHCKRHIHFLMLTEVKSDSELFELLKKIKYNETILVIEDIDATIEAVKSRETKIESKPKNKKKDNKSNPNPKENDKPAYKARDMDKMADQIPTQNDKKSGITLSGLLNSLDGIFDNDGRILIMTTNHPEVLDEALIRPGRCDAKFLFDYCNKEQIEELYSMFFNKNVPRNQLDKIKHNNYSPAHITSVFLRYRNSPEIALNHLDDIEQKIVIKSLVD